MRKPSKLRKLPGIKPAPGVCINHIWLVMGEGEPHECAVCGESKQILAPTLGNQKPVTPCQKHNWKEYPGGARECLSCGRQEAAPEDDDEWDE